jgi:hypothetical protein
MMKLFVAASFQSFIWVMIFHDGGFGKGVSRAPPEGGHPSCHGNFMKVSSS